MPSYKVFVLSSLLLSEIRLCLDQIAFIPTSDSGEVKKRLQFGWDFDLSVDFTADNAIAMKTQIKAKFETWSSEVANVGVTKSFCKNADCSDLTIDVSEYKKNFRLKFDIDAVP